MSLEQLEHRLAVLEQIVAGIQSQLPSPNGDSGNKELQESLPDTEALLPFVEYPLILSSRGMILGTVEAQIIGIRREPQSLALSQAEWDSLRPEDADG
jgi:hypothetical protein